MKSFFRRALKNTPPECLESKQCEITSGKLRSACTGCRFKKCLDVGMSKERIKTGRYTTEQRRAHVEEVKLLMKQQQKPENEVNPIELTNHQVEHIIQNLTTSFLQVAKECYREMAEMSPEENAIYISLEMEDQIVQKLSMFEKEVKNCIYFAKRIPGFINLHVEDQISLIRENRIEFRLLYIRPKLSEDKQFYIITNIDWHCTKKEVKDYYHSDEATEWLFKTTERMNEIFEGDDKLIAIVTAICVLSHDRCKNLRDIPAIERIEEKMLQCLRTMMSNRQMAHVFSLLTDLRMITDHTKALEHSILISNAKDVQFPTLLKETWYSEGIKSLLLQPLNDDEYQREQQKLSVEIPANVLSKLIDLQKASRNGGDQDSPSAHSIVKSLAQLPDLSSLVNINRS
ncbi:DgyrCDS13136 [Dimorphilus gyrociliatus]|uniref:DgyrCDS13136 n=1 Tax=Dimorphilus gyrociliatus TaxID=2664684 RepID=A0A7I8W9V0_9ANNE|nr:DgyrCDS13136 [Dimorphilus gyrociliatus]